MKVKYFKLLTFFTMLLYSNSTFAIYNVWTSGYNNGIQEYNIKNINGNVFSISCGNILGNNKSISISILNTDVGSIDANTSSIDIVMNEHMYHVPSDIDKGSNIKTWQNLINALKVNYKFKVLVNGEKTYNFTSLPESTKNVLSNLDECSPSNNSQKSTNVDPIPNVSYSNLTDQWSSKLNGKIKKISIENDDGDLFSIYCNMKEENTDETFIEFKNSSGKIYSSNNYNTEISILINGVVYWIPPTLFGRSEWYNFIQAIQTPNKFKVIVNDQKNYTFLPDPKTIQMELKELDKCNVNL
ncbi:hypothetical protein [Vibrio gazogenes]|uniref:Uncharacterized protein n=1 Tax=Vibrio gazogenes TaxID=687 RepID=A0A1Z2SIH9_VIBGA|nr:hypothetical protein [Vibrio gazogenes]ASA56962.1 hypothetical protein BSQ33_15495 [Vibrio gazogenes]